LAQAADLYEQGYPLLAAGAGGLTLAGAILPPAKTLTRPVVRGLESLAVQAEKGATFASKAIGLYDYPAKPQRPFKADYPNEALADDVGRLKVDIEGRPLVARRIVGRRVVGGPDEAISPTEFDAIAKEGTGRDTEVGPQGSLLQGDLGQTLIDPQTKRPLGVLLSDRLQGQDLERVYGHEIGHVIDQLAGEIETRGLLHELYRLYHTGRTGQEGKSNLLTPQNFKYDDEEVPRELMAEAIRAYATNPNHTKTVAPKTAAAIRRAVNEHPILSKIIHFNSIAAGLIAGAAAKGGRSDDAQAESAGEQGPPLARLWWEVYPKSYIRSLCGPLLMNSENRGLPPTNDLSFLGEHAFESRRNPGK
jgi:hypothetical protein